MGPENNLVLSLGRSEKIWTTAVLTEPLGSSYLPDRFIFLNWEILRGFFDELERRPVRNEEEFERWLSDLAELENQLHDAYQHDNVLQTVLPEEKTTALFERNLGNYHAVWEIAFQRVYERLSEMPWLYSSENYDRRRLSSVVNNRVRNFSWPAFSLSNEEDRVIEAIRHHEFLIDDLITDKLGDTASEKMEWKTKLQLLSCEQDFFDQKISQLVAIRREAADLRGYDDAFSYYISAQDSLEYSAADLRACATSVLTYFSPLAGQAISNQAELAGVEKFKPWQQILVPQIPYRKALSDERQLFEELRGLLHRISPMFGDLFDNHRSRISTDLYARDDKETTSFCGYYARLDKYFIATNLDGGVRSLSELFHEVGHFLETTAASNQHRYYFYQRHASELSEGIAFAMELIATEVFQPFLSPKMVDLARRQVFRDHVFEILDNSRDTLFESWLYAQQPGSMGEQWSKLTALARPGVDWKGYEDLRQFDYLDSLEVLGNPLISSNYVWGALIAFELFNNFRINPERTCQQMFAAMRAAGSLPLDELYALAGVTFRPDAAAIALLAESISSNL